MSIVASELDQDRLPIDELCRAGVSLMDVMESGRIPLEEEEERIESPKRERESSPDSPDENFGDEESPQHPTKVAHVEKEEGEVVEEAKEVVDNDVFDREEE
jgi:hypothetical protein